MRFGSWKEDRQRYVTKEASEGCILPQAITGESSEPIRSTTHSPPKAQKLVISQPEVKKKELK